MYATTCRLPVPQLQVENSGLCARRPPELLWNQETAQSHIVHDEHPQTVLIVLCRSPHRPLHRGHPRCPPVDAMLPAVRCTGCE